MPEFLIPNFLGGINRQVNEFLLKPNEAKNAQNCKIDDGSLSSCNGFIPYSTAAVNSNIGTLIAFYKDGIGQLLIAAGGNIYKLDGNSFTQIASGFTSNYFDYINFKVENDMLIFGNGINNTMVYDGTSFRDLKHDGKSSADSETNKAPKLSMIELHYERVWGAGDAANPDRVYFSTSNVNGFDPDDWTSPTTEGEANQHGGFIECPTFDGGKIIGLKVIFNDVLIFKNKNIFKIFGTYPGNYEKVQVYSTKGAIADKSIVTANNIAFFMSTDGIYAYNGTSTDIISEKIKDVFNNLNKSCLDKAVGFFYKNKYILAVPEGNSTVNNLIIEYNTIDKNFMLYRGIEVSSFIELNDELLFTNSSGFIYVYGEGDNFNSQLINAFWETGYSDLGSPNAKKNLEYVYFTGSGSGDIKLSCITEKGTKEKIVTLKSTDSVYKVKLKNKGRLLALKFENVNGSKFNIKSVRAIMDLDED